MERKIIKVIIGAACIIAGAVLYGFVHLATVNYLPNLHGWSNPPGKFLTALSKTWGTSPAVMGIALMFLGLAIFYNEYRKSD
ncbi:MAG: hypothetical protein H0Z40_12165 [Desulfotomaculum sp.]|nr:hypothetical protein [Desulfotomaculum sp.]